MLPHNPTSDVSRRLIDISAALVGLLIACPVLLVIAAAIKLDSRGPVLHGATRAGKGGRPFRLYKFRSMIVGAHANGPAITVARDPRITGVGRFLRRTKLDELPQLFNVLAGDMSLVGPRPEDPRYVARYSPAQRRILEIRPGVTSAASLAYRRESELLVGHDWERRYADEILPDKLAIDLDYFSRRTLRGDLSLILQTLAVVLGRPVSNSIR